MPQNITHDTGQSNCWRLRCHCPGIAGLSGMYTIYTCTNQMAVFKQHIHCIYMYMYTYKIHNNVHHTPVEDQRLPSVKPVRGEGEGEGNTEIGGGGPHGCRWRVGGMCLGAFTGAWTEISNSWSYWACRRRASSSSREICADVRRRPRGTLP